MIDSGATYDMLSRGLVEARFPKYLRDLIKATRINTANGKASVDKGVRLCSGPWDCATDAILMKNSPNVSSMGQRTIHAEFSFLWIRERFPCFISPCCTMIIISDVQGVIPIYSPCMETFEETMLGASKFAVDNPHNVFAISCGLKLGSLGMLAIQIARNNSGALCFIVAYAHSEIESAYQRSLLCLIRC